MPGSQMTAAKANITLNFRTSLLISPFPFMPYAPPYGQSLTLKQSMLPGFIIYQDGSVY
jgi:hypothetical protein